MRALIAIALACWVSLAGASQPPIKGAGENVQKQDAKAEQAAENRARETQGTASNPVFVKSLPSPESEADARHKQYEHQEKPTLDRWLTGGTVALAVFTFLLFCFTAALWYVTYRLSKDARLEFASVNRPQIRIKHVWISSELWGEKPVEISLAIVNIGLTPAIIRLMNAQIEILPAESQLPAHPTFPRPDKSVTAPKLESGITFEFPKIVVLESLTDHLNTRVRNSSQKLFCFGHVEYEDSAGRIRKTAFCRVLNPPVGAGANLQTGTFVRFPHEDYEYQD
jgi:hypothetical protein